jgi:hypothetical protein
VSLPQFHLGPYTYEIRAKGDTGMSRQQICKETQWTSTTCNSQHKSDVWARAREEERGPGEGSVATAKGRSQ